LSTEKNKPFDNITQNMLMFKDAVTWPEANDACYNLKKGSYKFNGWSGYSYNDFNMRSPKFTKNARILTSGCSHTWGVGLDYEKTWPNIVADSYDMEYSNVARPGSSVMYQVMSILQYCSTFGNPKVILCMFPNFERIRVFVENNILKGETQTGYGFGPADAFTNRLIDKPNLVKLPEDKDILVSENHAFYNSLCFIMILEKYCESNNINLAWSSWSHDEYDIPFSHFFGHYVTGSAGLGASKIHNCKNHEDLRSIFPDIFDEAADSPKGHFGVHWHQHVAELFIKHINESNILS
jgi:hypothetical protein